MYTNIRNVIQGAFVRYSCIGRDCEAGEDAYVFIGGGGGYRVHLCRRSWWNLGSDDRALVLIHGIAHHYYNTEDHGFTGLGASHCLDHFITDVNGLPQRYPTACKKYSNDCLRSMMENVQQYSGCN